MRVDGFLQRSAERFGDKPALICGTRHWTYQEVNSAADCFAASLIELGVTHQDRIAIFLDNSAEAVVTLFGILKAGAIFLVLNPTMKAGKLSHILKDAGVRVLVAQPNKERVVRDSLTRLPDLAHCVVCSPGGATANEALDLPLEKHVAVSPWTQLIEPRAHRHLPVFPDDSDLAALIYTSGSTGEPKGVMSAHHNVVAAVESITTYLENTEDDIILNVLPLSFDYGLYQILLTFAFGGTVVLEKSFAYPFRIIERLIEEHVTGLPIVPSMAAVVLRMENLSRYDFSALRYITNTAAPLPLEHIVRLQQVFPDTKIYSMYGLTECKRVSYLPPDMLAHKPSSVGIPMPNTTVRIVDPEGTEVEPGVVGELVVRGPNVMQGYWNAPEETRRVFRVSEDDGERLLYSGDLFRQDEEGYLYFVGRTDELIKSMGERVSPKEIENVLCDLTVVSEAAVIGVSDDVAGQAIKAYIVPTPDRQVAVSEILTHCRTHLEPVLVPKYVEIVSSLPKTAHGKVDKRSLKKASEEEKSSPTGDDTV